MRRDHGAGRPVRRVVKMYEVARRGLHTLDDFDDYITNPKASGYRSYYLI